MTEGAVAFQDLIPDNGCWGCGPRNPEGLHVRSFWDGDRSLCTFQARPAHCAGPPQYVNGGILAAILDCHCVCTATAAAYRAEGRPIGSDPRIWFVTSTLLVSYLRPTPIAHPIELVATIAETGPKRTLLRCSARSGGVECAHAEVTAVRVRPEWFEGRRSTAAESAREERDA